MSVSWTKEQQQVIDARNCNILVSAAAGSGKTAVLVERIIQRITDPDNPVDIDRMLIVTFTHAAASEMRERICDALEKKREENPADERIDKQLTLIHNAQITTIDSFCMYVVKNHFEEIGIDPSFRIADNAEMELLKEEVMTEVFEHFYEIRHEGFLKLVDAYSKQSMDGPVRDMIFEICRYAASASWPREWIQNLGSTYDIQTMQELNDSKLMTQYLKDCNKKIRGICAYYRGALAKEYDTGIENVKKAVNLLKKELEMSDVEIGDYDELYEWVSSLSFGRFPPSTKLAEVAEMKTYRDKAKKELDGIIKEIRYDGQTVLEQIKETKQLIDILIEISLFYLEAMDAFKKKKKVVEFSDVEHYALRIFVDEKTKKARPTAKDFRQQFDEIMIDEYQDSNQVQEDILCAISGMEENRYNMFMVGDVKQSIYRFRMAKPELFIDKYKQYDSMETALQRRIDLHKNFRSRNTVLDFTNRIFYRIMLEDMGGVEYDDAAALYPGANYVESSDMQPEILIYNKVADEGSSEQMTKQQREAVMVANRIRELMKNGMVTDKKTGELRKVQYQDIVILVRSLSGIAESLNQILPEYGIPVQLQAKGGYFSAYEVQVLLDFLTILDNPYQDVPMASVLKSPIVGLNDQQLARYKNKDLSFSEAVLQDMEEGMELEAFGKYYHRFRAMSIDTPIYKLIWEILNETGYLNYISCMPGGQQRKANIEMLLEKAVNYEKTSYKGLFHFIKYIQKIKKYNLDAEADVEGDDVQSIRIMTIHKSKGLEFPIVFLCGINKTFNTNDKRGNLLIHDKYGIGLHLITLNPKEKTKILFHKLIAEEIDKDNKGEELRILYVALTRAKEKLILTGVVDDAEKTKKTNFGFRSGAALDYEIRKSARNYFEWIYSAILFTEYNIKWVEPEDLIYHMMVKAEEQAASYEGLMKEILDYQPQKADLIRKYLEYQYPYEQKQGQKVKYSVSELKHRSMEKEYEKEEGVQKPEFLMDENKKYIPYFASEKTEEEPKVHQGALRGTAMHRVMECLDFQASLQWEDKQAFVLQELSRMKEEKKLTEEMISLISVRKISDFLASDIGVRMAKADEKQLLFKEKPFVMKHEEGYLVQGIIDVFWFEEDEIVLLDYKTDRVQQAQELVLRYKTQLDLYQDALCRVFSTKEKTVSAKESLIYSFALEEVIAV